MQALVVITQLVRNDDEDSELRSLTVLRLSHGSYKKLNYFLTRSPRLTPEIVRERVQSVFEARKIQAFQAEISHIRILTPSRFK